MKLVLAVEIPLDGTSEEIERVLGAPLESGYLLAGVAGRWALYRLTAASQREHGIGIGHVSPEREAAERRALDILRQSPGVSIRKTVQALAAQGIKRSKDWVSDNRQALASASGCSRGGD
jgi:hypothetical protein